MAHNPLEMAASPQTYRRRRAKLASQLQRPLVIFAGHAPARNYAGNPHPFRAGSTYLYFGGPPLEHAAWVIEPGSDGNAGCTLLRVATHPDDLVWFGSVPSDAELAQAAGIDRQRIADPGQLTAALKGRPAGAILPPYPQTIATADQAGLDRANEAELDAVIAMRLIKDEEELAAMRRAADAAVAAHLIAMAATQVGASEDDVEAALVAELIRNRCRPSFSSIITVRGEVLHGASAGIRLEAGALMLVDAGAEEPGGYASDITRTYPVSGEWTPIQRQLYDATLRAQREAIDACRPGRRYREIHALAAREICKGLIESDLLRGDPDTLAERGAYTLFFPHGVGHLLGLDAHDMEDFGDRAGYAPGRGRPVRFGDKFLRLDRDLEPGMVVTIEPGIYLVPAIWDREDLVGPFADVVNRKAVDQLLKAGFGGIRIEEDVHVRSGDQGPEVMTSALPNDAGEVARLVGRLGG